MQRVADVRALVLALVTQRRYKNCRYHYYYKETGDVDIAKSWQDTSRVMMVWLQRIELHGFYVSDHEEYTTSSVQLLEILNAANHIQPDSMKLSWKAYRESGTMKSGQEMGLSHVSLILVQTTIQNAANLVASKSELNSIRCDAHWN